MKTWAIPQTARTLVLGWTSAGLQPIQGLLRVSPKGVANLRTWHPYARINSTQATETLLRVACKYESHNLPYTTAWLTYAQYTRSTMRKYLGGDSPTCIIGMETQTCFVLDEWIAHQRSFTYVRGVRLHACEIRHACLRNASHRLQPQVAYSFTGSQSQTARMCLLPVGNAR